MNRLSYNASLNFDVAILGSGPAGCTLAMLLGEAGVSVATISLPGRGNRGSDIPETIPPALNLPISSDSLRPHYAMASAWATANLSTNHSICHPLGHGSFVDRAVFDRELEAHVPAIKAKLTSVSQTLTAWTLGFSDHAPIHAGIVVDATGRGSALARFIGVEHCVLDGLIALTVRAIPADFPAGEALVESAGTGWWFSVLTPQGDVSLSWFAYQDRIPFAEALRATVHTSQRVARIITSQPQSRSARTEWLRSPAGPGWLAVGDAAFASDPLGSQGLWRAFDAAKIAADVILNGAARDPESIRTYFDYYTDCVKRFLHERRSYYDMERRWPTAPFWKSAQAIGNLEVNFGGRHLL